MMQNEIPAKLTANMQTLAKYKEMLRDISLTWDNLTLLGQMSGASADMGNIRQGFQDLTNRLLDNLARETLKKTLQDLHSKAQVVVDILIRNLFERTADIGFLATDDDVRAFCKIWQATCEAESRLKHATDDTELRRVKAEFKASKDAIKRRFNEYVRKYSVYFNIILLDPSGKVIAQYDDANGVDASKDQLIFKSIAGISDYVETFGKIDLVPSLENSLIYSYKVTENNNKNSEVLGVLCLCFAFEDEMSRIFANLIDKDEWCSVLLLDDTNKVIASSSPYEIPIGAKVEVTSENEYFRLTRFAGREYLSVTKKTNGYQGYFGLGWKGHAMIPVSHAFDAKDDGRLGGDDIIKTVMDDATLFGEELKAIPKKAEKLQEELDRTVWNGNVKQNTKGANRSFSKVLLWEISNTGAKTKSMFEASIHNLHETIVSTKLSDVEFLASLAIDIMDRNLYERANDCRWWALTGAFRQILSKPQISTEDTMQINAVLSYINDLYTVYTGLFVFDKSGVIVGASKDTEWVGKILPDEWTRSTLGIKDSQAYTVSPFIKSALYGQKHTYIYSAAIFAPNSNECVGGIAIVFDSYPQFFDMLKDTLPSDGDANFFGVFVDKSGFIISSTDSTYQVGSLLNIDKKFFNMQSGSGYSGIVELDGKYYAVGARASKGYREYKSETDSYKNDVTALVFLNLGDKTEQQDVKKEQKVSVRALSGESVENGVEIASFYIAGSWFGFYAQSVMQAIDAQGLTIVPGANKILAGYIMFNGSPIDVLDLSVLINKEPCEIDINSQIIVVRIQTEGTTERYVGFLINELGDIPEVSKTQIQQLDRSFGGSTMIGDALVKSSMSDAGQMLVIIDPQRIVEKILNKRFG